MTLPSSLSAVLPDWLPGWVPVVLLIPLVLYALLALLVPFGVFGLKGRMEGIEARLDEIHAEIRILSLRLPPAIGEELPPIGYAASRPPMAPVTRYGEAEPIERLVPPEPPARIVRAPAPDSRPARAEPRFDQR